MRMAVQKKQNKRESCHFFIKDIKSRIILNSHYLINKKDKQFKFSKLSTLLIWKQKLG